MPEIFNDLCALRQNLTAVYCMKKLKPSFNLQKNALSNKLKMTSIEQIMRKIEANECNRL